MPNILKPASTYQSAHSKNPDGGLSLCGIMAFLSDVLYIFYDIVSGKAQFLSQKDDSVSPLCRLHPDPAGSISQNRTPYAAGKGAELHLSLAPASLVSCACIWGADTRRVFSGYPPIPQHPAIYYPGDKTITKTVPYSQAA
mgnify:CR=1 FL=1